jgi:hypothetical protein
MFLYIKHRLQIQVSFQLGTVTLDQQCFVKTNYDYITFATSISKDTPVTYRSSVSQRSILSKLDLHARIVSLRAYSLGFLQRGVMLTVLFCCLLLIVD